MPDSRAKMAEVRINSLHGVFGTNKAPVAHPERF